MKRVEEVLMHVSNIAPPAAIPAGLVAFPRPRKYTIVGRDRLIRPRSVADLVCRWTDSSTWTRSNFYRAGVPTVGAAPAGLADVPRPPSAGLESARRRRPPSGFLVIVVFDWCRPMALGLMPRSLEAVSVALVVEGAVEEILEGVERRQPATAWR